MLFILGIAFCSSYVAFGLSMYVLCILFFTYRKPVLCYFQKVLLFVDFSFT
jgi:hypothetical protein